MDAQNPPPMFAQGLQVTQCLSLPEGTESIRHARDGNILGVIGNQLEEESRVRPTLVELSCGMKKPGAITQGRGDFQGIS